ncbi:hypothetical protein EV659_1045 [Rhodothalassium salexigens DSM 2132]|uniref:Uncharacterized protein n=1 Tax=Rhodothalassium salexigens DSM 2132 TaxID=1188247 RepID=A0A4V2SPG7_RHOSA|nr:hypothetical protein [Rhodothalassium salexigens]MBB4211234.1 hypothetical protein [Rhodothalassium salexigens DSM 2132]MBK1639328.1 hypothetical protein [Rhodothalassium salexigens DSM 2132]TCP35156.1 hypothetical protein EV659_1045 [Rhodothalassium salexigens DSM 2132]
MSNLAKLLADMNSSQDVGKRYQTDLNQLANDYDLSEPEKAALASGSEEKIRSAIGDKVGDFVIALIETP